MRMLVFPYGYNCEPIVRHANFLEQCYEIVALVSPGGWGMAGKNIVLGKNKVSTHVYERIEEVTEEFDSLFIPDFGEIDEEVENRLINEIIKLFPNLTHIICAARFTSLNEKKLKEICQRNSQFCDFINYSENKSLDKYGLMENCTAHQSIKAINIPVVCIVGWWEKTDKFEVSLMLREHFLQAGYQVSQVGSRSECEMFGFHSFPDFMYNKNIDAEDKIIYFNRWIDNMVRKEKPDLLIITIPGAMQNFNNELTRGFGILHHLVFQSIIPDILIMCTIYLQGTSQALENISKSCKYKFGAAVDAFHMSNLVIDKNDSEERGYVVTSNIYRKIVSKTIAERFCNSSIPVFNMLDQMDSDNMFDTLMDKLIPNDSRIV